MRIAIFDLGSTSFHALVVDADSRGRFEPIYKSRETLHLAAASAADGHMPQEAVFRALRAARQMRKEVDRHGPELVVCTATAALRDAANGDHLIERLEVALRTQVRVIEGDEEAELAYRGAIAGLSIYNEPVMVIDLGGGSLDVATGVGDDIDFTATFPIGATRMTALHATTDPLSKKEIKAVKGDVEERCEEVFEILRRRGPMRVVVVGGTGRAIGRLLAKGDVDGLVIPAGELHRTSRRLISASRDERKKMPGMAARRIDVLPVGSLVLSCFIDGIDAGSIALSAWGLREGVLLETLAGVGRTAGAAR